MKYFKRMTTFEYLTKDDFDSPAVEISKDEFLKLCENSGAHYLGHGSVDGEKAHIIGVSKYYI